MRALKLVPLRIANKHRACTPKLQGSIACMDAPVAYMDTGDLRERSEVEHTNTCWPAYACLSKVVVHSPQGTLQHPRARAVLDGVGNLIDGESLRAG